MQAYIIMLLFVTREGDRIFSLNRTLNTKQTYMFSAENVAVLSVMIVGISAVTLFQKNVGGKRWECRR